MTWASALMVLPALAIPSPSGSLALLGLAALSSAIPAVFAIGRVRLISLGLLLLSVGLCVHHYPAFRRHMAAYRQSGLR